MTLSSAKAKEVRAELREARQTLDKYSSCIRDAEASEGYLINQWGNYSRILKEISEVMAEKQKRINEIT